MRLFCLQYAADGCPCLAVQLKSKQVKPKWEAQLYLPICFPQTYHKLLHPACVSTTQMVRQLQGFPRTN